MDIFCVCRTCLNEPNSNFISIYSQIIPNPDDLIDSKDIINNGNTQISNILDELTGYKYNVNDFPYPDKICDLCFKALKTVFEFRYRCEIAFERLIKLSEVSNSLNALEPSLENNKPLFIDTEYTNVIEFVETVSSKPLENNVDVKVEQSEVKDEIQNIAKRTDRTTNEEEDVVKFNTFQCYHCDKTFKRKTHLKRHILTHTDERAYSCKTCDKKFRRADHLKVHENYHAKIKPYTCSQCEKSFFRSEHLRRHIASRHNKLTSFPCKNCDYVGTSSKELSQHRKVHAVVLFTCKTCDEKFASKPELTEHMKEHNGNGKPYLCSECGQRFIRHDYLVVHIRRHKGEKPFKCKYCDRGFPRASDLNVHELYHTNEKKHMCPTCGKGFQRAYNLTVHMRVHTGEKPFECPHCPKKYSQGNDLKAHIRRHTGERYQCEICDKSFIQIYLLNNHKANAHGINVKSNICRLAKFECNDQTLQSVSQAAQECETGYAPDER